MLLNEFVWFPKMNQMIENKVKTCKACQVNSEKRAYEPFKMSALPEGPWIELSMVQFFYGPIPSVQYLIVVMDEYSRYPVVSSTKSIAASKVIPILKEIFATFGIPKQMKTDNVQWLRVCGVFKS